MEEESSDKGKPGDIVEVEAPENDKVDEDKNKVLEPKPGMKFVDDDEMYEFYRSYGEQTGFPVRRKSSKKGDDGVRRYVTFACSRGGKASNTSNNPLKSHPSIRIGCKARIAACLDVDGRYRLNSVVLEHNHELSPSKAKHFRCNRAHRYHYSSMLHSDHYVGEKLHVSCHREERNHQNDTPSVRMEDESSNKRKTGDIVEVEVPENDRVHEHENQIAEPEPGMKFASDDEMFEFYRNYGEQTGFAVSRKSSKKGDDGLRRYVTLACSRARKSSNASNNPLKSHPSIRIGCKARIAACLDVDGKYRLNSVVLEHNHELSTKKAGHFRWNRGAHVGRSIGINDKGRIKVKKNCNSFGVEDGGHENILENDSTNDIENVKRLRLGEDGGHENISFGVEDGGHENILEKDSTNDIENVKRLRLGEEDVIAIQNYFSKMQSQSPIFFFSMNLDEEGRLKNVFWADGRSREAYKEFGEVVTFETTYLTEKYELPLVTFVGVNHHGQSTLLGCGLVCSEDTETFCSLLQTWLACMSGCAPSGIITDQDSAVKRAIEIVFPDTRHRWCLWHVMKRLSKKLSGHEQYDSICFELQDAVYDSQSPTDFEHNWSVMVDKYELHDNEWLIGLYNERHRWVPCFVKTSFWAGMSTTQRNEKLTAFFDEYINSKTTLKQFVEKYDNALRNRVEKESQSDLKSFGQLVMCVTPYEMEKQVRAAHTLSKFEEFQNELIGKLYCEFTSISIREDCTVSEYGVRENAVVGDGKTGMNYKVTFHRDGCEVNCNCNMFEYRGILCRHAIGVLIRNDVEIIPEKYILYRWRKDVTRPHTLVKINYDGYSVTPEQLRYDNMCTAFTNVAKFAAGDEKSYIGVMEWINKATMERPLKRINGGSNQPTLKSVYTTTGSTINCVGNQLV